MNITSYVGRLIAKRWHRNLLFIVLTVLPIVTFFYLFSRIGRRQFHAHLTLESTQIAHLSATLVQQHFQQSTDLLQSFADRPTFRKAWMNRDMATLAVDLKEARSFRPDFAFVAVYDLDGTMRAIYPPQPTVLNKHFAFRDWYQGASRQHKAYISEVYRSSVPPRDLVVAAAVPVVNDQGQPVGLLTAAYALDTVSRKLVGTNFGGEWIISLVDQEGHLSARPGINPQLPPVDLTNYPPVQQILNGRSGNGTFVRNGTSLFTRYEPIPDFGWGILVEKPSEGLNSRIAAVERPVFILGLLFLVGALMGNAVLGSAYSRLEVGNRFIDLSPNLYCVVGPDGVFRNLNPIWEKTLGFSVQELMSKPFLEFVHPEDRGATTAEVQKVEKGYSVFEFENRYVCKDGSVKWLIWNAVGTPQPQGFIYAVAHDITELKQSLHEVERQNRTLEARNREVEHATRMKSRFLASMSHELRTPLNAIVGFSDLIAEGTAGPLNPKQHRFISHVKLAAAHLLQLINDILDLSKIEAGQLEMRCEDFDTKEALPEVLSVVRPLAIAKNITIEQKLNADSFVYADRIRFKQILYNLLSNAVKFTPKGGQIDIECHRERGHVVIAVTDSGIGIRAEDQKLVFEEFRQVQGNGALAQEGTGLGLAITRHLVERQGGTISLASAPGQGSRFFFTLPCGSEPSSQALVTVPPAATRTVSVADAWKPLVLVVDDEPATRELLASYLSAEYRVATVGSGDEALARAHELRPDAITLDVLIGAGSGFDTLVTLRNTAATANIPIIILSIVDQKRVGFALGANDYLVKPIRKQALLETMRQHVPTQGDGDDDTTILVVDDNSTTVEFLEETLRAAGYETQSVRSGVRALEVLSSKVVGAVLLDLLMPGVDGFQVLRHIRQQETLKHLPVFVMTAKNLSSEETDALSRDAQVLLQKNGTWQQQLVLEISRVIGARQRAKAAGAP